MFRFFETLVNPYAPYVDTDTPPTGLFAFLNEYLKPLRKILFWSVVLTIVIALSEIGFIYALGQIVDLLNSSSAHTFFTDYKVELILITVFLLVVRPIIMVVDAALMNQSLLPNLGTIIRWRSHRHVLRQSVGWFQNDFAGRIANRLMQAAPAAGEAVYQILDALLYSAIYLVGALWVLAEIDARLALPLVIWLVMYCALIGWLIPRIGRAAKSFADARSEISGRIIDSYSNIQSVKLFAHHSIEEDYALEAIEAARQAFARQMRLITLLELGLALINGFLIVGVVGWSILLWQQGISSIGTVAAAAALTLRLSAMTGWMMWSLSSLFQQLGVISEGMETIAQPITLLDKPNAPPLVAEHCAISLSGVSHHYGREKGGLDNLTLAIKGGEKVGIVGRSGAGKSTLVNLLLRFHDVERGFIKIDGQDIRDVTQESLRRQIGMVTQDSSLMHRSVRANILYGKPDATEEQMIRAAKSAEAHDFVQDLSDPKGQHGYAAEVGERGVKLSGGQRQRIALARVILKDAPILVLDEATSALDSEVESAILETLYGVMEGKTVIAIAHRLSTIAKMDRIVVLDQGKVIEQGSHSELLAAKGLYANFWDRQSGGFIGIEEPE